MSSPPAPVDAPVADRRGDAGPVAPAPVRGRRRDPLLIGVLAVGVGAAGAGHPSLWFDEAATVSAATRSLPELVALLQHIDAVHGLYYLLMHGWLTLVPVTEFWLRAPSCLAFGVAAAGVVVLCRRFTGRAAALTAGVVFAILPRMTWAAVEARSYAFTAAAAVWLTVLLVAAARRGRTWLWPLYGMGATVSVVLNVYLGLLVAAHGVAVLALSRRLPVVLRWLAAAVIGVGALLGFLDLARTQIGQIAWISPLGGHTVVDVLRDQYFDGSTPFAIAAGAALGASFLLWCARRGQIPTGDRQLAVIAVAWLVVPTAALLVWSAVASPIYYPRYLCFTAPAIAVLLGMAITHVARRPWVVTGVLLAFAAAAAPTYVVAQRGPYKAEGMDYSQIADVVVRHARPGDCLLLDNTTSWKPGPIRPLLAARPSAYRDLVDPGRGRLATETDRLWDGYLPLWTVADRVRQCTVLWTVSQRDPAVPARESGTALAPGPRLAGVPVYQLPRAWGFRIVERWQFNFAQIVESRRPS